MFIFLNTLVSSPLMTHEQTKVLNGLEWFVYSSQLDGMAWGLP